MLLIIICIINIIIYIFSRPALLKYGLWDQIRVDHGKEWVLSLYIQELLADQRTDTTRAPYLQTSSKLVRFIAISWFIS